MICSKHDSMYVEVVFVADSASSKKLSAVHSNMLLCYHVRLVMALWRKALRLDRICERWEESLLSIYVVFKDYINSKITANHYSLMFGNFKSELSCALVVGRQIVELWNTKLLSVCLYGLLICSIVYWRC